MQIINATAPNTKPGRLAQLAAKLTGGTTVHAEPLAAAPKDKLPVPPRRVPTPQVEPIPGTSPLGIKPVLPNKTGGHGLISTTPRDKKGKIMPKPKAPKAGSADDLKAKGKLRSKPVPILTTTDMALDAMSAAADRSRAKFAKICGTPVEVEAMLKVAAAAADPLALPPALKLTAEQRKAGRNLPMPKSKPGSTVAVPERKMPTKAELEAKAKALGLNVKGKLVSKNARKQTGIGATAKAAILAGKTNEEALDLVMKAHPNCTSNVGCISWYRNDLRKKGLLARPDGSKDKPAKVAAAPKAAKKPAAKKAAKKAKRK